MNKYSTVVFISTIYFYPIWDIIHLVRRVGPCVAQGFLCIRNMIIYAYHDFISNSRYCKYVFKNKGNYAEAPS